MSRRFCGSTEWSGNAARAREPPGQDFCSPLCLELRGPKESQAEEGEGLLRAETFPTGVGIGRLLSAPPCLARTPTPTYQPGPKCLILIMDRTEPWRPRRRPPPASACERPDKNATIPCVYSFFVLYLFSWPPKNKDNARVSASVETPACNRSIEARRAARLKKARREARIVDLLNRGVAVAEIAARDEVTEKRMRALVSGSSRSPQCPSRRPSSSRFRRAVSARRFSSPMAPCRGPTFGRSIGW